ncbi:MAG: tripartite tricarboxylate transporter TctB family protein [Burkholderiaceae bacterium]
MSEQQAGRMSGSEQRSIRWAGASFLAWAAVLLLWLIPGHVTVPSSVESTFLSPRFWPTVVAAVTALIALLTLASGFGGPGRADVARVNETPGEAGGSRTAPVAATTQIARFLLVALLLIAYGWSIDTLGVVIATAAFVLLASILVLRRVSIGVLLWSVLLPITLAWFFRTFVGVMFPVWPALGG